MSKPVNMITGKAIADFRIPDVGLVLRGHVATVPKKYADMIEQEPIKPEPVSPTIDDMIRTKVQQPKVVFNKKQGKKQGKKQV